MAPRRNVDKGKRPMTELETEPQRSTRSRGLGVRIAEPQDGPRRVEAETARVEPEQLAQEAPRVEQLAGEVPSAEQAAVEQGSRRTPPLESNEGGHERPEPSRMTEARVDLGVTPQQMAAFVQLVVEAIRQYMEGQAQQHTPLDPVPSPGLADPEQTVVHGQAELGLEPEMEVVELRRRIQEERSDMRAFQKLRPPSYLGEADYVMTDRWVSRMEKIFEYLQCTEEQKMRYGTFMLEGDAEDWWRTERETLLRRGAELTWAEFLDRFYRHYVPASERTRRAAEFALLTQGSMTVSEYDSKYRSLSRFVGWTQIDLKEKARKFQEGLKLSIRGKLAALGLEEYGDILDRARRVEREEEEWAKLQEKRRGPESRRGGVVHGREQRPRRIEQTQLPYCTTCRRQHVGPCMAGSDICFGCGQQGHRRPDCPYRDATCPVCGKVGHTRDVCYSAQGQRRVPQRVHQLPMDTVPIPARGQRGRPPQYRQQAPAQVQHVLAQEEQVADEADRGNILVVVNYFMWL